METNKPNFDNDGLDPSEEYFRKKQKDDDEDTYFPTEGSKPSHYKKYSKNALTVYLKLVEKIKF